LGEDADGNLIVRCGFNDFGNMMKALEERNISVISSEIEWIPENTVSLSEEQAEEVFKLIARVEEDDDVQQVFHNMA
jgi:transcriptional/translational regulatory protein YebC/TACO1